MLTKAQKLEKMVGYCTSCAADIIDLTGPKPRALPAYREHTMSLSNDTLMRVGVCADCEDKLNAGGKEAERIAGEILANHKKWWENNLRATDRPAFHENLAVVDITTTERDFRIKQAEINREKRLVREWQAENLSKKMLGPDGEVIKESFEDFKSRKK